MCPMRVDRICSNQLCIQFLNTQFALVGLFVCSRGVAWGGGEAEGAAGPPALSLIEKFSKDDTTPLTTPKRGKNDVEMP